MVIEEVLNIGWLVIRDGFWSAIATIGFAVLFNVPSKQLTWCTITGATGRGVRKLLMEMGLSIQFGTLVGATIVGFMSHFLAQRRKIPSTTFSIPGVIPMVPGFFAYQTMIGLLEIANANADSRVDVLTGATINAVKTAMILGGIAVGIAAPKLLFYRQHPVA
jgi:uncharacterized membrane protein YjjB (DUF3815 family)